MRIALRDVFLASIFFGFTSGFSASPAWWATGSTDFTDDNASHSVSENYGPANVGQLKNVASQAKKYLDPQLPNNSFKTAVESKLSEFAPQNGSGYSAAELAENYAPANLGQLKALAKPFYDWLLSSSFDTRQNLIKFGYSPDWQSVYPWIESAPVEDNYAPVNIGQVKLAFAFDLSNPPAKFTDTDGDGLPDSYQSTIGGAGASVDSDADGLKNLTEYLTGTDPLSVNGVGSTFTATGLRVHTPIKN